MNEAIQPYKEKDIISIFWGYLTLNLSCFVSAEVILSMNEFMTAINT